MNAPASGLLARRMDHLARRLMTIQGARRVDFTAPPGEAALTSPQSVSWRVFKNPVSLFIGGVTAVILEFAEPRVRSGVWDHSTFRSDPLGRLQRTGLAAMVTVYGAHSVAEAMIADVVRLHGRISGATPDGTDYRADDPELLTWVHATAAYGFLEAYCAYASPLSDAEKDRYYAEAQTAARLYGAATAPASRVELQALFQAMRPRLEASDTVHEFLAMMSRGAVLPGPLRPLQGMLVKAAVETTPDWARAILGLGCEWRPRRWEARLVGLAAKLAERTVLPAHPAVQACRRLGLPDNYLFRRA